MALRSVFDAGALKAEFESAAVSPSFIPAIWKYVLQNPGCDLDDIPSLPSKAYPVLRSKFRAMTTTVTSAADSKDRVTTKLLIRLQNGSSVEAVIMRYDTRLGKYDGKPRLGGPRSTLCVSSQVGCKMGCKFCATGTMGFKNNLSSGEIVEQLVHANRISNIRNVVFMGMGEPLNNYTALVEAVQTMIGFPFQLSAKRITVSTLKDDIFDAHTDNVEIVSQIFSQNLTRESLPPGMPMVLCIFAGARWPLLLKWLSIYKVGIIHAISKLHDDLPNVNLAVSLHAPDQDIRCQIMPAARAFPLARLIDAMQAYQNNSGPKIFIEYIMLDGVNDQEQHAHQLGKLLEKLKSVVNLIPFNPIGSTSDFKTSSEQSVKSFQRILRGVYNIRTTVRKEMGQDISGACGQLVVNLSEQRSAGGASLLADIEDLHI